MAATTATPKYGRTEPRIFTPPLRELTEETSAGFSVIRFSEEVLGITLMPWQRWLLIHALELVDGDDGRKHFRFRSILILVGRQNGKSTLTMILILWFMLVRRVALVIGTAQSLGISEALWEEAVAAVQGSELLRDYIHKIHMANGGKRLRLDVGDGLISEYKVEAASRKGARGRSGDLVVLDELREHQDFSAWSAASNTTLARPDGLVWCITNAGDASSVVLRHLRDVAHRMLGDPDNRLDDSSPDSDGQSSSALGFFEWSAPPDADPSDPATWAYANPSAGRLISWSSLRDAYVENPQAEFLTECLCQWVVSVDASPFPDGAWEACEDQASEIAPDAGIVFGVDVAPDRRHCSIAVCGRRADGHMHIELVFYATKMSQIEAWFRRRVDSYHGMTVCLQARGCPASALVSSLRAIPGVSVYEVQGAALTSACGQLYDAICAAAGDAASDEALVYHLPQPGLDLAAEVAQRKTLGDGAWAWDRRRSREDISPLCAATWAYGYVAGLYDPSSYETRVDRPGGDADRKRAILFV